MKTILSILTIVLCQGLATSGFAENWTKFFTNVSGYEFFINEETIAYPKKNTVLIWYKSGFPIEVKENGYEWIHEWMELREVDCSRRRYKRLQGTKNVTEKLGETDWVYLEPNDLDIAFYNVTCRNTPEEIKSLTNEELCEKLGLSYDKEIKKCK
jgi:hypothetical protein